MKKTLLVSGCSNTEHNFYSDIHPTLDCSWPKWPELLAKKLDMDCVNLAKSGQRNEYIYTTLLEYITRNDKSKIGLVIPAWTQNQRRDYQKFNSWNSKRIDSEGDIFFWTRKHLDYCLSFQILCERYNLPYIQVQMLTSFQNWMDGLKPGDNDKRYPPKFRHIYPGDVPKDKIVIAKLITGYEDLINTKRFIGWPLTYEFGGFNLQQQLISQEQDTMLSKEDSHPNAKGQEKIAEFIYDRLG